MAKKRRTAKAPHPGGRPQKKVDLALVENMGVIGLRWCDLPNALGVSERTLQRRGEIMRAAYDRGFAKGNANLMVKAYGEAIRGNTKMLALVIKNRCDYVEKKQISGDINNPLIVKDVRHMTEEEIDAELEALSTEEHAKAE